MQLEFPSYYFYPSGIYPPGYPPHPNPPPPKPLKTHGDYAPYSLTQAQLNAVNREINLYNTQMHSVVVDFMYMVTRIRRINPNDR